MTQTASALQPTWVYPRDIERFSNLIVNVYFVGEALSPTGWTLIDAGLPMNAHAIDHAARRRFGTGARPNAIVLTHGHFDHVGSLQTLARHWDVPIWAHRLEAPYLTGRSAYPPPDPTVGGGAMSLLSPLYPRGPIDVSDRLMILPEDGSIPPLPGWKWIHTPGHSAGHISLFRESDRSLIVGDAFCTTRQESAIDALAKPYKIHGPPMYFTSDWEASRESVASLLALEPAVAFPGHGNPVGGDQLLDDLTRLVMQFDTIAKPATGRYVDHPAVTNETGTVRVPPFTMDAKTLALYGLGAAGVGMILANLFKRRDE